MRDTRPVLLQACVNGARSPAEHPAIPVTAAGLARDAQRVAGAGAESVHLHVKDDAGIDTADPVRADAVLTAVRAGAPGLPVGVTTGAWAEPDPAARIGAIRAWTVLPDFASVNWHEAGAEEVATCLLGRGVAVEAGLWHADAVARWLASPLAGRCLRVLVELPADLPSVDVPERADMLLAMLQGVELPVLLHGEDGSCWAAVEHAGRRGLATRIGLEDSLVLPDGRRARDNVELVAAALHVLRGSR